MFEDILGQPKNPSKPLYTANNFKCPFCGTRSVEEDGPGVFRSSKRFNQGMVCNVCCAKWRITYNEKLEIIDVKY